MATDAAPTLQLPNTRASMSVDMSSAADGLSDAISLKGHALAVIQPSTAWTPAAMTFLGSIDSTGNYYNIMSSTGGEMSIIVSTLGASLITLNNDEQRRLAAFEKIKIRSGTGTTGAVAQGAPRVLKLGLVPLK